MQVTFITYKNVMAKVTTGMHHAPCTQNNKKTYQIKHSFNIINRLTVNITYSVKTVGNTYYNRI